MTDLSKYSFVSTSLKPVEGHDHDIKQVMDALDKKEWPKIRKYFLSCYYLTHADELNVDRDISKELRSWEKTSSYKKYKDQLKKDDYDKMNIASILSAFSFAIALMFVKNLLTQTFVVNFIIDAVIGVFCIVTLLRNYIIRYRIYRLYTDDNWFLTMDLTSAIFCVLLKVILPGFVDISMIIMIVNYFVTVRKQFKKLLENY
ncbi:hypothetical protein [Floccifex sp.]|uniref:hypothetical protein n=1 Tax=Floccifex sp. TaxID=2815810 RepID=UPI003F02965E|nr:hypothetical protein [Erysipelotrichaceae bacterium]